MAGEKIRVDFGDISPISKGPPKGKIKHNQDLFHQSMYWEGLDGWYVLSQMSRNHRENCVRMMLKHPSYIREACMVSEIMWELSYISWLIDRGMGPVPAVDWGHEEDCIENDEDWLRQTPLFKRMNLGLGL